jgi:acyl-CoA synthetase (AMP-forming)/AMP-acid ligase II/acyl carrier protein
VDTITELSPTLNSIYFKNLVDCLQERSRLQPDRRAFTFLVDGEEEKIHITYAQLDRQAREIAARLQAMVSCGSRVLLCYPAGLEFIAAFFGCLYAGAIAVPVAPPKRRQKQSRFEAIVKDARPEVVMTTQDLMNNLKQVWLDLPELPSVKYITSDLSDDNPADLWQQSELNSSTLAFLQYTSGSTGKPKGVMVSHGNLMHNSAYIQTASELTPATISVSWLPNFHDMGLIDGIIQPIYTGFLGVLMSPTAFIQKPIRWLRAISLYRATHGGGPNQGYELCVQKVDLQECEAIDLSSWQSAYTGAEPIRRSTLEQFIKKFQPLGFSSWSFYPCYGMAEATLMISGGKVNTALVCCTVDASSLERGEIVEVAETESNARHFVSVGHSRLNSKIACVDPETKRRCRANQVGEIWVSGESIAQGYWQQTEATQATFQAFLPDTGEEPWLRTGDLGFMRGEELFITGRLKDLLIFWGRNHYPQDIEWTVQNSHPALRVDGGAAISVEIDDRERLVIVQEVERTHLQSLPVDEVIQAIRQAVSERHEIAPAAIALIKPASLPKTSSGKIQRQACRAQFLAGTLATVAQWTEPPASESSSSETKPTILTEEAIAEWIIANISQMTNLDPDDIDPDTSFFRYGLDSSVVLTITGNLSDWLGRELMPTLFWEYPTLTELVSYLINLPEKTASET